MCRSKKEQPSWGAPKIREKLIRLYPDLKTPAVSTVHAVLDRHGLVTRRKGPRRRAKGTVLSAPREPNDLWCADYKGEFMLADRRYCYPLTVTDHESRYLLVCEALGSTRETLAFPVFERAFREFGLPRTMRTDNGVPFASPNALYGLSRLSVWWLMLRARRQPTTLPALHHHLCELHHETRYHSPEMAERGQSSPPRQNVPISTTKRRCQAAQLSQQR